MTLSKLYKSLAAIETRFLLLKNESFHQNNMHSYYMLISYEALNIHDVINLKH